MSRTVLLVGTRKGAFLLESDEATERLGSCAARSARTGRCTTRSTTHSSGTIYAAAASEWHGSSVWRSADLGETWEQSSEGLAYEAEGEKKMSKVSNLAARNGRLLVGVEMPGIFESTDGGVTWSLFSTLAGVARQHEWDDPANQPPGHLGVSALMFDTEDDARFWAIVQGMGLFETTDNAKTLDAAERWASAPTGRGRSTRSASASTSSCARRSNADRMYQQNHVGMHRSDDCGQTWTEITEGLPTEFGFAAATHPHDKDTFYVIPLDPGHGRTMPDGEAAVWRTQDAGESWQRAAQRPPAEGRVHRRPARRDGDRHARVTRPVLRDEHRPGVRERRCRRHWAEIASYLPAISSVEVAIID